MSQFFDDMKSALKDADIFVIETPRQKVIDANGSPQVYISFAGLENRNKMISELADVVVHSFIKDGPGGLADSVVAVARVIKGVGIIDRTTRTSSQDNFHRHTLTVREDPRA